MNTPAFSTLSQNLTRRLSLIAFLFVLMTGSAWAQSTDEDAWEEEDDEEEVADQEATKTDPEPAKYEDALIKINDEVITVKGEYSVKRDDVLNISVRQLHGGSPVIIEMKKGGINLDRKVFYANNKGELDLEVKTGNKKVRGDAVLYYTPKGSAKKTIEVKIIVE